MSGEAPPAGSRLAPVIVALVAFALAWTTLLPGVGLWDTAEFQTVGPVLGTAHPTGYPTYVLLGWLASVVFQALGEPAFRLNLLAAILAGLSSGLCVVLVEQLARRPLVAVASGIVFAALPVAWRLATHADPHGLHGALVALLLVLLVGWEARRADRWLVTAAAVLGLALGNHSLTFFLVPGIVLFVLAAEPRILERRRLVLRCALTVAVVAGLVYLELPLRAGPFRAPLVYGSPDTLGGFLYVVSGAQFIGAVEAGGIGARLAEIAAVAWAQFGPLTPFIPLALVATAIRRPRYALLTVPAVALTCWFSSSYVNADIERYYLGPALMVVTWLAILADAGVGLALGALARARGRPAGLGVAVGLELVAALLLLAPTLAALPSRAAEVDRSRDRSGAAFLDRTLPALLPDAVVVSWWDYSTALWYAQLCEGRRLDVSVIDDRTRLDRHLGEVTDVIDANLGQRPVYLIRLPADLPAIAARYRLEYLPSPEGQPIVRVIGRLDGGTGLVAGGSGGAGEARS